MQRFKNFLVLYAGKIGDEATLERAAALARRNDAKLTVEKMPGETVSLFGKPSPARTKLECR